MRSGFVWVSALALLVACKGKPPEPLHVAAAADLAHAFAEITPAFTAQTPSDLKLTVGATGLLARQIMQGAPFDLFLAANTAYAVGESGPSGYARSDSAAGDGNDVFTLRRRSLCDVRQGVFTVQLDIGLSDGSTEQQLRVLDVQLRRMAQRQSHRTRAAP